MKRLTAAQRRETILEAAADLMIAQGWFATSTRDVTSRLSVGAGLLHHHFSGWRALQLEAAQRLFIAEMEALDAQCRGLAARDAMPVIVDWLAPDTNDRFWSLWIDMQSVARTDADVAAAMGALIARLTGTISSVMGQSATDPDANPELRQAILALLAASQGLAAYALATPPLISEADYLAVMTGLASRIVPCRA